MSKQSKIQRYLIYFYIWQRRVSNSYIREAESCKCHWHYGIKWHFMLGKWLSFDVSFFLWICWILSLVMREGETAIICIMAYVMCQDNDLCCDKIHFLVLMWERITRWECLVHHGVESIKKILYIQYSLLMVFCWSIYCLIMIVKMSW